MLDSAARHLSVLVAAVMLLAAGQAARAQDQDLDLLELSLDELMQVESVSKTLETLAEAPAVVTVYTREHPDRLQPRNLLGLLELTTGFLIERDIDDEGLGSRGVVTDNNQKYMIAIDGHRVSNGTNFGVNPFHKLRSMIHIAERIEIIRGPGGVLWGPEAFLGLINVVTRRGEETGAGQEEKPTTVSLTYGPGNDTKALAASYVRAIDEDTSIALFADVISSHGEEVSTELAGRGAFDTTPGTYWERFETPSLTVNGRFESGGFWVSGQFLRVRGGVEGLASPNAGSQTDRFEQVYVELGQRRDLGESHTLTARLYADDNNAARWDGDDDGDDFFFEFPEQRFGAEVLFESRPTDNLSTIFGWDARYLDYEGGGLGRDFVSANGKSGAVDRFTAHGLFGQLRWHFSDFVLHLAGRWDTFSDDRIDDLFVPRVSLGYQVTEQVGLKLLYTEGALRPSWTQLTGFFSFGGADNPNLEEEKSRTVELQALFNAPRISSSLSLYETQADDTINLLLGPDGFGYYNYADYTTTGLEWQNRAILHPRLEGFLNLTYYFGVERDELVVVSDTGENLFGFGNPNFVIPGTDTPYNIPEIFFSGGVTWSSERFDLTPIVRYKGERTIQGIAGEAEDIDRDTLYLDLKARYRMRDGLELTVVGRNVLGDDGIVGFGTGEAGFIIPKGAVWEIGLRARF